MSTEFFYTKSELETIACQAYQRGFTDSKYIHKIDIAEKEQAIQETVEQYIERKIRNQFNTLPESLGSEIGRYLVANSMRKLALERLEAVFWPEFNALYMNNMQSKALELARALPECSLRMKAIAICEKND